MQEVKKIWIILGIILAVLVLVPAIFLFKYKDVVGSFISTPSGRVNILVLGKGGTGHDAPDLTDTIILASVSNEKINLVSLPRDIWISDIRAKLNSAYYWGRQQNIGFKLVDDSVEEITGARPDYNLVIDFSVFKDLIDALGGVKVDVQNSFVDTKYPIEGRENDLCGGDKTYACRYETITFKKGPQMMDGVTALKFVRSRNAEGTEGTDFAREVRQQLVISAIKNKVLSPEIFLNSKKIKTLINIAANSIETDIPQEVLGGLARKAYDAKDNISSNVIPENLLVHPPISIKYDKQYVFIPKAGDWSEIRKWILDLQK